MAKINFASVSGLALKRDFTVTTSLGNVYKVAAVSPEMALKIACRDLLSSDEFVKFTKEAK